MLRSKKITLYMPCKNEAANLKKISKDIPSLVDEIIVISNCSTDDSLAVAKKLGFKAIEDNRNIKGVGYGYAHMSGLKAAEGDIIIGVDSDGTYPLDQIETLLNYMADNNLDFLSCSRYPVKSGTKIPLKLRIGVKILNIEARLLYGIKIKDLLSGMWLVRKNVIEDLRLDQGNWNLSPQIKINAYVSPKIRVDEFNIEQYSRGGRSHQDYIKTGWSHLSWIFVNWLEFKKNSKLRAKKPKKAIIKLDNEQL